MGQASEARGHGGKHLEQPLAWQRKAQNTGIRPQVFCSELSDVFVNQAPAEWRADLWQLIARCPNLDWLLLTKRPQNFAKMLPAGWPWPHVSLGITAGKQAGWQGHVPLLRNTPATMRFVSVEPMLGPIIPDLTGIDLVICGGETDKQHKGRARPTDPDWARDLRDACAAAGVAFFFKQMTERAPIPDDLLVRQWQRRGL